MEKITKERLSVIGRLIGIYRNERRNKSQNKFTQRSFSEGICTVNTLKKIEAGELPRFYDIYPELLEKLDLNYGYFPAVDEAVCALMDKLYEAIEYYQIDKIIHCCEKGLRILTKVREYVYYSEIHDLFLAAKTYYKDDIEINLEHVKHYERIYLLMDEKYSDLYKRMIWTRMQIAMVDDFILYENVVQKLDFMKSEYPSMKLLQLHYYGAIKQYISMKNLINELEVAFIESNNYVRLLDVYSYAIMLYSEIEKNYREDYIDKVDALVNKNQLNDVKVSEIYAHIAYTFHNEGEFGISLSYFEKMLQYTKTPYLLYLLYIVNCQKHLGKKVHIPSIDKADLMKYSTVMQVMYNYYQTYDVTSAEVKENIIIKEIAPYLLYDELIEIFRYELRTLLSEKGGYKSLFLFEETVEKAKSGSK